MIKGQLLKHSEHEIRKHQSLIFSHDIMLYDDILKEIGGWGRYQKWICFLLVLSAVPNGYFTMIMVFTSKTPEHRCRIIEIDGPVVNETTSLLYNASGLDLYIPWDSENNRWQRCERYVGNSSAIINGSLENNKVGSCEHGYVYNIKPGERTAVTEWNMVCENSDAKPRITSLYMSGVLVGSILSGVIADWCGRWPVIIFGTYFQFIFMILNVFNPSPVMYAMMMFLAGGCSLINFVAAVVLGAELIDAEHRAFMETAIMNGFAIGYMILPLFAYFILDWKMLLLATGLTGVIFIPYWWLMPESPRWLIIKRKYRKAEVVLQKIAKCNGKDIGPDSLFTEERIKLIAEKENIITEKGNKSETVDATSNRCQRLVNRIPFLPLLTKRGIVVRTLCLCCTWWVISLIYYTINLNTGNLAGDDIINCFISACVEIPAYTSVYCFLRNRGRRWLMVVYMSLSALFCVITPFVGRWNSIAAVVSAMIGKFCVTSAFSLVYLYSTELFPTEARNQAMGLVSMCARIGSVLAPYIIFMGDEISADIPYLITGVLAFLSASLCYFLPETQGKPLPDTYADAEKLKRQPLTCGKFCNRVEGEEKPTK